MFTINRGLGGARSAEAFKNWLSGSLPRGAHICHGGDQVSWRSSWPRQARRARRLEFGDRVVVVIDMESGQRFIIRCEAAIPLPALVHVLS